MTSTTGTFRHKALKANVCQVRCSYCYQMGSVPPIVLVQPVIVCRGLTKLGRFRTPGCQTGCSSVWRKPYVGAVTTIDRHSSQRHCFVEGHWAPMFLDCSLARVCICACVCVCVWEGDYSSDGGLQRRVVGGIKFPKSELMTPAR